MYSIRDSAQGVEYFRQRGTVLNMLQLTIPGLPETEWDYPRKRVGFYGDRFGFSFFVSFSTFSTKQIFAM